MNSSDLFSRAGAVTISKTQKWLGASSLTKNLFMSLKKTNLALDDDDASMDDNNVLLCLV
jgi:hypothetical protein